MLGTYQFLYINVRYVPIPVYPCWPSLGLPHILEIDNKSLHYTDNLPSASSTLSCIVGGIVDTIQHCLHQELWPVAMLMFIAYCIYFMTL